MRSALLLLVGFAMVAGGVGLTLGVDGGLLPGIALAVLGLLVRPSHARPADPPPPSCVLIPPTRASP